MALQRVRTFALEKNPVPLLGTDQGMFGLQVRSLITALTELTLLRKTRYICVYYRHRSVGPDTAIAVTAVVFSGATAKYC